MENIWNWHKRGTEAVNIDSFVNDLKKANGNKGILFSHQYLRTGDIGTSSLQLLLAVRQNPELTDKVLTAAIEMHRFCGRNCKRGENAGQDAERLTIPAMLDILKEEGALKHSNSTYLTGKVNLILKSEKDYLLNDEGTMMRSIYDQYKESFRPMIRAVRKEQNSTVGKKRNSAVIEI